MTISVTMAETESQTSCSDRRTETFYCTIRPLAVLSKILGAFPLGNTLGSDGRKVTFSFFALIHLWDFILFASIILEFMYSCSELLEKSSSDDANLTIWVTFTCYVTIFRTIVQFLLVHIYSSRIPRLLQVFEEYHQGIGSSIVKNYRNRWLVRIVPILKILAILTVMETASFFYFFQFQEETHKVWPVAVSYMYANVWRELPMNMFLMFVKYLKNRLYEIRDGLGELRNEKDDLEKTKKVERLRLQHAALVKAKELIEDCYGMQIAVNIMFLLMDVVLQWFIYFVIAATSNYVLLLLSMYFFCMSGILVAWVELLRRTDEEISQEIITFELYTSSQELQMQVQMFATQIAAHPSTISASGFFNVNNSILGSLLGAIATYVVLMVQFTPYFEMYLVNITLPSFDFLNREKNEIGTYIS